MSHDVALTFAECGKGLQYVKNFNIYAFLRMPMHSARYDLRKGVSKYFLLIPTFGWDK